MFCEGGVTPEDLTPFIGKVVSADSLIVKSNFDTCPGEEIPHGSREGYYLIFNTADAHF